MDNNINELKKNLPKESCSFCTHLSLDGPDENFKYNEKIDDEKHERHALRDDVSKLANSTRFYR